jgi:uncharacterized protein (TIGR02246 family)
MKRVLYGLLCLALLATAPLSRAQNKAAAEKAVRDGEMQWLKSQRTNNPSMIASLLADGFVMTDVDGKVTNKAETLERAKATKYASVDYTDLKVRVFGDTAIATGGFRATGTDASGKPMNDNEQFTDTWTKMANGKWQCVASHASPVKM